MSAARKMENFWDFSVRIYRVPGVADACLSLQNDHGADVNMLLYCCWIGRYAGKFDNKLFAEAIGYSTEWSDKVVTPIRSARSWMKHTGCHMKPVATDACMVLREEIKSVEFAAEKQQQRVLETLVSIDESRNVAADRLLEDVTANLDQYCAHAGIALSEDVRRNFSVIIDATFPDLPRA